MLSVKTAERRHVPAATSIQIYSISPPTVVYLLVLSFLYNNHYSFFLSKIEKENKITRNNFFFFFRNRSSKEIASGKNDLKFVGGERRYEISLGIHRKEGMSSWIKSGRIMEVDAVLCA